MACAMAYGRTGAGGEQTVQGLLADAATELDAAMLLVQQAALRSPMSLALASMAKLAATEAAMAKLLSSETAERVASLAVNLHGGNGFVKEYPVEKLYRDAKIGQIYEGTSNLQLETIAKQIIG